LGLVKFHLAIYPGRGGIWGSRRKSRTNSLNHHKEEGEAKIAQIVSTIMPMHTVTPIDTRAAAAAPLESISGETPRVKAKNVIRMSRKRSCEAPSTASSAEALPQPELGKLDDQDGVFAINPPNKINPISA
jgi:hypothetical protein